MKREKVEKGYWGIEIFDITNNIILNLMNLIFNNNLFIWKLIEIKTFFFVLQFATSAFNFLSWQSSIMTLHVSQRVFEHLFSIQVFPINLRI